MKILEKSIHQAQQLVTDSKLYHNKLRLRINMYEKMKEKSKNLSKVEYIRVIYLLVMHNSNRFVKTFSLTLAECYTRK